MEQIGKRGTFNLRGLNGAFITNIQGKTAAKRCVCIPVEDNFVDERGYVNRAGQEVRLAEVAVTVWPVSDESKQQYGKKHDWEMRLDIGKSQREALAQRDPQMAARLDHRSDQYDRDLVRQVFPYVGQLFDFAPTTLAPEAAPTTTAIPGEGDDDLPF